MKIKYDGTEESILTIMENLPFERKWIKREVNSITIPTPGARQVFKGETVVIEDDKVKIIEKYQ